MIEQARYILTQIGVRPSVLGSALSQAVNIEDCRAGTFCRGGKERAMRRDSGDRRL